MKHKAIWIFGLVVLLLVLVPFRKLAGVLEFDDVKETDEVVETNPTAAEPEEHTASTEEEHTPVDFPPTVDIEIKHMGDHFEPSEIVLYVGQVVTLSITNTDTVSHDIIFGRDVKIRDGKPAGFDIDFLVNDVFGFDMLSAHSAFVFWGYEYDTEEGSIQDLYLEDQVYQPILEGHPLDYHGHVTVFPPAGWVGTVIPGWDVNFVVVEEMVGEWEFACFADFGQHYLNGERGRILIRKP